MKNNWQSKIRFFILISLLVIVVFTLTYHPARAGSNTSQAPEPHVQENMSEMPTNQIIIKYKTDADQRGTNAPVSQDRMQTLNMVTRMELKYLRAMSGDAHVLRLPNRMSVDEIDDIASSIEILPDVEYAEPDYIMVPSLMPGDPQYSSQWHYFDTYGINAPAVWDITTGTNNVTIAVIDTGITDHADLTGRWVGGYDFITDVPTANDGNGRDGDPHDPGNWITFAESSSGTFAGCPVINSTWHGTHVAGIIGASGNNGTGVVGVNWVSQIVPVRVLGKCGGFTSDIADGMRWAAGLSVNGVPVNTNPAKVLNISFGGPGVCSATYQNAINAINTAGSIIIVAAGNNSSNLNTNSFQPANCNGVIPVSATDRGGDRAFYSNFGTIIKISAPGGETNPTLQNGVLSTLNTGTTSPGSDTYGYFAGTSMAAPHVTGVVSLMLSIDPTLTFSEVLQILQNTARSFPAGSNCTTSTCGSGIVDAAGAVDSVDSPVIATHTMTFTPTTTATPTSTLTPTATPTNTPTMTRTNTPSATVINTPAQDVIVTDTWALQVLPAVDLNQLALQLGAQNLGQIGTLTGYYLFRIPGSNLQAEAIADMFSANPQVLWFEQQVARQRSKRIIADPNYPSQEHVADVITVTAATDDVRFQDNAGSTSSISSIPATLSPVPSQSSVAGPVPTQTTVSLMQASPISTRTPIVQIQPSSIPTTTVQPTQTATMIIRSSPASSQSSVAGPVPTQTTVSLMQASPISTQTSIVRIRPSSTSVTSVQSTKIAVLTREPSLTLTTILYSATPFADSENNSSNGSAKVAVAFIASIIAGGVLLSMSRKINNAGKSNESK